MSTPVRTAPDTAPLLGILQELHEIYSTYAARAEDLIAGLVANDFAGVQSAVAAQTALVARIEQAERRRRAAVDELVRSLTGRATPAGPPRRSVTMTALLMLLPPDQADQLTGVRHDLLATLVRLQTLQRQATALVRNAQTVIRRALSAGGAAAACYGPQGEQALPRRAIYTQQGRWA
jgi:flagellar FlgN protein